jgi:type IV pilus assembly protein PilM
MAGGNGVWGIDIGQSALKALRGTLSSDGQSVVAEAFDYVEYPKILSQPDAKPDELIRDALKQFLSRNDLRNDKVCISLSGQSGLARFVALPPVDAKKIPNIVAYEAKQQIPFSLDDVIWDYQQMPGGTEQEGFALESEVGIFAMKRDQVFRSIRPLVDAEVELDVIQLTPLAIYNAVTFDLLNCDQKEVREADEASRKPIVVLSMGTDASDLVVTDGFRVWQRSIPLGGNHFTKQLTKELKLTFAKAEHVKRNARKSDDAKEIFQAMRPVFSDLVTQVHRSLGFYQSLERSRTSGDPKNLVVLGNAAKLPGLPQYLEKNLDLKVLKPKSFKRLTGASVTEASAFSDNALSFAVCYGLVLQGLGKSNLRTNLLPREIMRQRLIRRKKPWAAAVAATLLLGCALNYSFLWRGWNSVRDDASIGGMTWGQAKNLVVGTQTTSGGLKTQDEEKKTTLARVIQLGEATVSSADGRFLWLELMKMINEALPVDASHDINEIQTIEDRPLDSRQEIYIDSIESRYYPDLTAWESAAKPKYADELAARQEALAGNPDGAPAAEGTEEDAGNVDDTAASDDMAGDESMDAGTETMDSGAMDSGTTDGGEGGGEGGALAQGGWVIEIKGHHFFKQNGRHLEAAHVRNTLVEKLDRGDVELPTGPGLPAIKFTAKELGIFYPHIVNGRLNRDFQVVNPRATPPPTAAAPASPTTTSFLGQAAGAAARQKNTVSVAAYEFTVAFAWTQVRLRQRLEQRENQQQADAGGDDVAALEP